MEFRLYRFRTCISQAKYKKLVDPLHALRSIVPDLLYYEKRDAKQPKKPTLSPVLSREEAEERWASVKSTLISNSRPCLRLLVQYPATATNAAEPGHCDSDKICPKYSKKRKRGRDCLVTIQGGNGGELFGTDTTAVLDFLERSYDEN